MSKPVVRLISHPLCPFTHRCVLVMLRKGLTRGVGFTVDYVDLADLPGWFHELSPQGRMPVLELSGRVASFEPTNIAEYLDDVTPGTLLPADAGQRLTHRDAITQCGVVLETLKGVFMAADGEALEAALAGVFAAFAPLQAALPQGAMYFDGQRFSLVDAAYAPVFSLMLYYPWLREHAGWTAVPRVKAYGTALLDEPGVADSRCPEYRGEFEHFFALFKSAFAKHAKAPAAA